MSSNSSIEDGHVGIEIVRWTRTVRATRAINECWIMVVILLLSNSE